MFADDHKKAVTAKIIGGTADFSIDVVKTDIALFRMQQAFGPKDLATLIPTETVKEVFKPSFTDPLFHHHGTGSECLITVMMMVVMVMVMIMVVVMLPVMGFFRGSGGGR